MCVTRVTALHPCTAEQRTARADLRERLRPALICSLPCTAEEFKGQCRALLNRATGVGAGSHAQAAIFRCCGMVKAVQVSPEQHQSAV